jgi:beta-lactamase superfamily II metal-dependent hydrolase
MLPAAYGDCLLITYGTRRLRHVLIDAGTQPTWANHLRPHLVREGVRRLELFVLTHIDADHIAGAIPMLEDPNLPLDIGEVWFNGRKQIAGRVLSVNQGERFSALIAERKLPWNEHFDHRAVCVDDSVNSVKLVGGLKLTVLSPTRPKLDRLARVWKREVDRHFLGGGAAMPRRRQFLARTPTASTEVPALAATKFVGDSSVPNGSSIALLAEFGMKSMLLAGDAHAPVLCNAIKALRPDGTRLPIDALKVSHHGSRGNTSVGLLDMIACRRYLVSCNGDVHYLPDNEAIGRIIQHGGPDPQLHFNYQCERTRSWDSAQLRKKYRYSTEYGDDGFLRVDV